MTAKVFDLCFNQLMKSEGGYVNDPNDSGGETKYGVSKRAYPDLDIANLTIEQAKEIYKKDYWARCKCDYLPDALSVVVADTAYNSGCSRAIKILQKSLGVTVDGIIGNGTIGAANTQPVKKTLACYKEHRLAFLQSLKTWRRYGKGWNNRVNEVTKLAETLL